MMVVASLVPNFLMGIITGAGIIGIMMMTAGFFHLLDDLPKPFWRYLVSYISYGPWALKANFLFSSMAPYIFSNRPLTKGLGVKVESQIEGAMAQAVEERYKKLLGRISSLHCYGYRLLARSNILLGVPVGYDQLYLIAYEHGRTSEPYRVLK